jgi:hypothetical protein
MDMRTQYADGDSKDAVSSAKVLQGLVNRESSNKIYLFNDSTDSTHNIGGESWNVQKDWIEKAEELKALPKDELMREKGSNGGLHGLIGHFSDYIKGLIVWDDNPQNKVSMAAFGAAVTIASQKDALAVSPCIREEINNWGYDFPVLIDLRDYGFGSDHELTDWCIDNFWENSNRDINCVFSLGLDGWAPNEKWGDNWLSNSVFHEGPIDYAVAINGFSFNINVSDANDEHVLMKLLRKYPEGKTAVLGWIPTHPFLCGFSEVPPCLNSTSYFVIGVNGFSNPSVFASFPDSETYKSKPKAYQTQKNDVFINFLSTDGDALHCVYRGMFNAFTRGKDESFGKIPITWTIDPILAELAPPVYSFFVRNLPEGSDFAIAWADKINSVWDTGSDALADTWKSYSDLSGIKTIWTVNSDEATQRADICNWDSIIVGYQDSRVEPKMSGLNAYTSVFGTWSFGDLSVDSMVEGIVNYVNECPKGPVFISVALGAAFDEARSFYSKAVKVQEKLLNAIGERSYKFVNAGDMARTYKAYLKTGKQFSD